MPYCVNCGTKIALNAKFCHKCGHPTGVQNDSSTQKQEFAGKLYKCPSCGEVLKAFEINCPACGYELRGTRSSNAVKEFALKLEAIESRREYEKPRGLFVTAEALQRVSKTDEQKISLIKSFSIPNTKEDMLEFIILATSSINMEAYDSSNTSITKSERELNAAWFAKARQVYEKAKRSYSSDDVFAEIKELYDKCNDDIKKSKKKGVFKWFLSFGWIFVFFVAIFIFIKIYSPISEEKEVARLDAIVIEIEDQLEKGEFKYALMNADTLVYSGTIRNEEQKRQWVIKREYWIDKIIKEAAENGIILERPVDEKETKKTKDDLSGGFIEGFKEGLQPGLDATKEKIDEFNRIINGEETDGD